MLEDIKRVIRSRKMKDKNNNDQEKKNKVKRHTMIYKTPHRKLKIDQHEPLLNQE